ncbi:sensor histidine kinase [Lusitaniella coriacea LEGE 07157]|uniref:histidine kinase n=1 Tax=Lusitaniella coriacea LEGE 07157 TaxID=945747 RepID=A0A8J7DWZ2_9CYAN|nr:sensor histidine kinase [Lusitaniella coriacea]MBE9116751.1 sensor histidine kinase [Lusitaniella coriacea LEGE 07157]
MKDIGKALISRTDVIIEEWIKVVRQNEDIESAKKLAYKSVRNSLPYVLEYLASLLSEQLDDQSCKLEQKSLKHGLVRAEQGYDSMEIVREYALLRQVLFSVLEPDLLSGTATEVLKYANTINQLLDEIIAISLERYIEARLQELEKLQDQLILTNQELNRLVGMQKEELSHLAHELKNPLNSIIGFSTLLLQQQRSQTQNSSLNIQVIERMLNSGQQLLRLINNTLEISRYEAGKVELNLEPVDVRALVSNVTEIVTSSVRGKDIEVVLDCSTAPERVLTDSLRLQQILTNLTSNALRYTESGTIRIICQSRDRGQWMLAVSDTGKGISPEVQEKIFEPYFRVGSQGNYLPQSTGLGLAIVAKLVKLLGGEIQLESKLGEGSTFTVTFPLEI